MAKGVIKFKDGNGQYQEYVLSKPITTVGRSRSNDVVIDDTSISRLHVRIEERSGRYVIIDNNSSNGTFVNRKKITESPIQDGDTLIVGRVYVYFTQSDGLKDGSSTAAMPAFEEDIPAAFSAPTASFRAFDPQPPASLNSEGDDTLRERPAPVFSLPPIPEPPPVPDEMATIDMPPMKGGFNFPPPPPPSELAYPQPTTNFMSARTVQPASLGHRFLAQLIDGMIAVLVFFIPMLPGIVLDFAWMSLFGSLIGALLSLAHVIVGWKRYGKTLGKHLLHLKIVSYQEPAIVGLSWKAIALRLLVQWVSGMLSGLPYLYVFFNRDHRALHDLVAETFVVESR